MLGTMWKGLGFWVDQVSVVAVIMIHQWKDFELLKDDEGGGATKADHYEQKAVDEGELARDFVLEVAEVVRDEFLLNRLLGLAERRFHFLLQLVHHLRSNVRRDVLQIILVIVLKLFLVLLEEVQQVRLELVQRRRVA